MLSPLRDALTRLVPLTESAFCCAVEELGCQKWRHGLTNRNYAFVSSVDPEGWKTFQCGCVETASRSNQSYNEGYMIQLIQQIIASRADRCVLSTPMVKSFQGAVRKQNCLRLALPPLPAIRNWQGFVNAIPHFS
jgi:hypothetical protein